MSESPSNTPAAPRVLHVIDDLAPCGAASQLRLLVERSDALVATRRRPNGQEALPASWLGGRFRRDPFAARRLVRLVREQRPDALQSWDALSARLCRTAGRLTGTPWVHAARGGEADQRWAASADGVVASDQSIADRLATTGIASRVVPNAHAPELASDRLPSRERARADLRAAGVDVAAEAPVLATVARLDDPAGLKELVWAADLVRAVRPGLRLLVVGDGPARNAGERFASRACEAGLVVWLGEWRDLATVYAAADVVWCGRGEGACPTPAVEAWAAGKPTVIAGGADREPLPLSEGAPQRVLAWDDRAGWARATQRLLDHPERVDSTACEHARRRHGPDRVAAAHAEAITGVLS